MNPPEIYRTLVLSVVKHDYIARALSGHPRFELVAVTDDPDVPQWIHDRNRSFATEFGIPYEPGLDRANAKFKPHVAVVSSEAERHCQLSVAAAERGLHIVQDKPMSDRLAECDRLVDAVKANQVRFLMWNRNLLPAIRQARETIDSNGIGPIGSVHMDFYFAKDAGPPKGARRAGDPPLDWLEHLKAAHATGADGGVGTSAMGELSNEACYPLAIVDYLTGYRTARVFAQATSHFHQLHTDNHVEDLATLTLEFENGRFGSLTVGRIGRHAHPNLGEIKLHLVGAAGALVVNEPRPEVAIFYRGQPAEAFRHIRIREEENGFLLADHFATAIDREQKTVLDVEAARHIAATVAAGLESAKRGQVVDVQQ